MSVHDDEVRALVRQIVRRHLTAPPGGRPPVMPVTHPSSWRFELASGGETGGPCLIEPDVSCVHCGYCQSRGF
jgi:hypothetical protein